jgi:hypothetical protein
VDAGATVEDWDRQIGRLAAELAAAKRARKSVVQRERMAKNKQNDGFIARWRHGIAISMEDPDRRARRSFNAAQGQKNSAKGLPPMTRRQHLDYRKLRRYAKATREAALAEVLRG